MTCFYYPTTLVFQWHQVVNDLFLLSNYSGLSVAPSREWPVSIIQQLWSFSGTKSWKTYFYYPITLVFQWHQVANDLFLLSNYSGLSVALSREIPISIIQLLWSFSGTKSWMTYFYYPTTLVFQWHQVVNDLFLLSNYSGLSVALSRERPISIIQLLWSFSGTKSWMTYFYYPTTLVFQWHQVVNDLFLLSNYSGLSVAPRREWPVSIIHLFWSFSGTKWWMTCFYYSTTLVFQWHQVVNDLFLSNYSGLSVAPSREWPVSIIQLLWSFSGTKSWMTCFYYPTTLVFQWHQVVNDLFLLSNYSGLSVAPSREWPVSIIQLLWSFSGTKSWMTYFYYPTTLVFQWHQGVNDLFLLSNYSGLSVAPSVNDLFLLSNYSGLSVAPSREWPISIIQLLWSFSGTKSRMTCFYYPTTMVFQWHQVVKDLFLLSNYSGLSVAPSREWPVSIIQLLWSFSGTKSWNDLFLLSNYSGLSVAPSREWPISIIQLLWSFSGTKSWMTCFYYPTTLVFQWHQVVNDLFLLSNYSGLSVAPSREWPVSIIQLLWSFSGTKSWMTCFYYPTTLVFQWHQVVNDLFLLSNYSGLSVAPSREWPISIIQLLWSFSGTKSRMTCFYYPTTMVFQWHQVVKDLFLLSNYSGLSVAPSREWPVSIIQLLWSFSGTKSWNDLFLLSNYSGLSVAPSREWPISIIQLLWSFSGTKSWMTCFYYPTTLVFQWHQVVNDLFLLSNYSGLSVAPSREWPISIIQLLWSFSGTKSWMTCFYYPTTLVFQWHQVWMTCFYYPTTLVFQWHQVVNDLFLLSNYSGLSVAPSREWPVSIIQQLWSFSGTKSWKTYFYYPITLVFQWHQVANDLFLLSNYSGLSVALSREMTYFYYPTTLVFQWHQVVNDLFLLSNYSGLSVAPSREWPVSIIQLLWSFSGTKSWMTYFYYPTTLVFQWHQVVNDLFLLSNYSGLSVAPSREWPVSIIQLLWSFSGTKAWMTCFYYPPILVFQWHQVVNDLFLLFNYSGLSVAPSREWPVSIQLLWSFSGTKSWMTCFYYPTTLVFQWHQVVNDLFLLSNYSGLSVAPSREWPISIIQLLWSFSGTKSWMTCFYYPTTLVFQWH